MPTQAGPGRFSRLRSRWEAVPAGRRDTIFAVLLTLTTQIELLLSDSIEGSIVVQSASFAAMTLAIAWRRTIPLLAAGLLASGLAIQTLAGEAPIAGGFLATLIVMYSVGAYAELKPAVVGGAMILAAAFLYPFVADIDTPLVDELVNVILLVGPWILGRVRWMRAKYVEAETNRVARDHDQDLRDALSRERGRIARDMHDIVAHGVSMMVLQTGAARQTLRTDADKSEELLLNVEGAGRQALEEMQLLLEVLRAPSASDTGATTHLTIASLADLAERTAGSGTTMRFTVEGDERPLSPGLEVSAYRIAQEALTNSIKHGAASHVDVAVTYRGDSVKLVITDNGRAVPDSELRGGGNGLIGMRERAELFGGEISAGPRPSDSGWIVTADLPIPQTV